MIELATSRLLLRPIIAEKDYKDLYWLNTDPEVIRYTGDAAFDSLEACLQFYNNYKEYEKNKMGRFCILLKSNNEFLGWCGLKKRENGDVDLGYRFFKKYWNQGYATESSIESLRYGFDDLQLDEIIAEAISENLGSVNVMQKIGMKFLRPTSFDGAEAVTYHITKEEYHKQYPIK